VLLAFIDESSNRLHYRTLGLIVHQDKVRLLLEGLNAVMDQAAATYEEIGPDDELHGHDLFHGTETWAPLRRLTRARISIYRQALEVVAEHCEAFFVEGLDRGSFQRKYADEHDEHVTTLLHLLEKLDRYADRRGQDLIVVADEHHTARAAQEALRRTRNGTVWGYRGRPRRVVDTIYFVSSEMSRPVQAADMVAFLHQRVSDVVEVDKRAARANELLWSVIAPSMRKERIWKP
jgi:hypothetical protein